MGSAFLTTINLGLGLYCVINFIKSLVQFGLPNHPSRFTMYLVNLCVTTLMVMQCLADFHFLSPWHFVNLRAFPLVIGSLALLMEVTSIIGHFNQFRLRILSRIPLIAGLVCATFFNPYADMVASALICISVLFLIVSVGERRYQKRIMVKMSLFLAIFLSCKSTQYFGIYLVGVLFLFPALFYLFIFQQSFGISALVEEHQANSGVSL